MLAIRPFRAGDEVSVASLLKESWLVHWAPFLPLEAVARFRRDDPAQAYVEAMGAEFEVAVLTLGRGQELVGMIHVIENLLGSIHVRPDRKGQGIGSRLLDRAEAVVAEGGFPQARLEVRAFNAPARTFYAHRGWIETSRYLDTEMGVPVETIEMVKSLRPKS